jgi:hypothetical protein
VNAEQKKTVIKLAIWCGLLFLLLVGLLWIEISAIQQGGDSTISRMIWGLWADQPWVIFLVSHILAAPTWFLLGHFTAQSDEVYKRIRSGGR